MKIDITKITSAELKSGMELAKSISYDFGSYDAYIVGGCVRDIARAELGQTKYPEIHDVDIATNMSMEELVSHYKTASNNGEAHGTMLVFSAGTPFEVTQFRTDGTYSDGRHPDSVKFAKTFDEDVTRRDFTINAIGMNGDGEFIDPVGGLKDIESGIIRAVGNPEDRFNEDALRILRGIRFSINFNYVIHTDTILAMIKCASGLANISGERVRGEILKLNKQNGGFVRFLRIIKQIGADKYLECFKDVLFDDLLRDADKIKDFTNKNVFPIILNNAIDYRATAKRFACTRDDVRQYAWYKDNYWTFFLADGMIGWTKLVKLYSGDYETLLKLYGQEPIWQYREDTAKYLSKHPVDSTVFSKELLEQGVKPGERFGELLAKKVESEYNYKAKVYEFRTKH